MKRIVLVLALTAAAFAETVSGSGMASAASFNDALSQATEQATNELSERCSGTLKDIHITSRVTSSNGLVVVVSVSATATCKVN